jgi:hypothetical protein
MPERLWELFISDLSFQAIPDDDLEPISRRKDKYTDNKEPD